MECDGLMNSCLLLGLKNAVTTSKDKAGFSDVQSDNGASTKKTCGRPHHGFSIVT